VAKSKKSSTVTGTLKEGANAHSSLRDFDVSSTQAAELRHGFNVKSLVGEASPQTSIHRMVQFDVENHSKPTVLSMSTWKGISKVF